MGVGSFSQIMMNQVDEAYTTFYAETMTSMLQGHVFKLVNTGATYQTIVNKIFKDMLGRNLEAYVDDMLVKSVMGELHTNDLW